ncbi:MAG TPA: peptidase S45 [Microscillaceae bacterium]|nr:peptidase S45 [Microscillaceae bacterium]
MKYSLPRFLLFIAGIIVLGSCSKNLYQSTTYKEVEIIRDKWGVPHIKAATNAQVAYGLAWAECEDDFKTVQEQMMAIRGYLGEINGKAGITADLGIKFMGLREVADQAYPKAFSQEFLQVLHSFVEGVNAYARAHPKEVMLRKLFPLVPQDLIAGYLLGLMEITNTRDDLEKIISGKIAKDIPKEKTRGSNAIAVNANKTKDGDTYLAINSHQPMEGWYSWYEAHLVSDEGLNILGATFPMGITIFHGVNPYLGWAHTVNHADFSDIYQLEMHPTKKNYYKFDGQWLPLEKKKYKSRVKIFAGIKIGIKRTIYLSKYGPTFKTDKGYFAWSFSVQHAAKAMEQWYNMNKARNIQEFKKALAPRDIPSTNIVYADREGNIFYVSNARIPKRDTRYQWDYVLPGNTSATLWDKGFIPFDSLPQVTNPSSGYVFNTNNTPFSSSGKADNPKETALNKTMGFKKTHRENPRSSRFMELMEQYQGKISYEEFKRIKFDRQLPSNLAMWNITNLEILFHLKPEKYPDVADAIKLLNNWDRKFEVTNTETKLFMTTLRTLSRAIRKANKNKITEELCYKALKAVKAFLIKKYGKIAIPLGDFQKHIRGNVEMPIAGGQGVLAAMYNRNIANNKAKVHSGETYIELIRFTKDGVKIESISPYGSSARPESPHYTDQMKMFANQQLKSMSLDINEARKNAERIYHPVKFVKKK